MINMSNNQRINSLNNKVNELKDTLRDFQNVIDNENLPLKKGMSSSFGLSSDQGKKILVYVFWYKLFYDQIESTHHEGKDFLMDHFDIPNANILGDLWMTSKSIEAISDIPEIKAKFKSYNNVPVPEIDHGGKLHITPRWGIDSIELIDIFDLIREYLVKQVQSLDSNQEELTNRLSEIEGDLYELRQSANRLLEKNIKNTNEATIIIVALVIVAVIIIGYFYVST